MGIDRMSVAERIRLAQEILETVVAEQPRPPISEAMKQFLQSRIDDAKANPEDCVPWEEVYADAMARYAK
jgi:putative addiction module component (TIGR02574 family)